MKKIVSVFLCLILFTGLFTVPSAASPANARVTVKTTTTAPVINGVVEAGEYGEKIHSVDYSNSEFISSFDMDKSINADFYMTWTNDSLYMAWVVYTDGHWPIPINYDHNGDGIPDLGYMYLFSCVQFMLCTGAPDASKVVYQTGAWSGNYLEAGLSVMSDGSSYKVAWSKPVGGEGLTVDSWDFMGKRNNSAKTTTYEVRIPFAALGMTNIGSGTQFGLTYAIGDQENFNIAPNMCEWQDAILGGKNMDKGAVITLSSETIDGNILGKPVENPKYNISVAAPSEYIPGDTVNVTLTLNDIISEDGFGLIQLLLFYDSSKVEPVVKNDDDMNSSMDDFLITAPNKTKWEGLCKLEEAYSRYDLSFFTIEKASHAKTNGSVVIRVAFTVKSTAKGDIVFQVPHASTVCADYDLKKHYGNAGLAVITEYEITDYLGTPVENPAYSLSVTAPEKYIPGGNIEVTVTLNNVTSNDGFVYVHFFLYYDKALVEPIVKNDGDMNSEMEAFLVTAPNRTKWEVLCKLEEDSSRYDVSLATVDYASRAKEDGSIVVKIGFTVLADVEDSIIFYMPHASTICLNYNLIEFYGNGSLAILTKDLNEYSGIEPNEGNGLIIDEENGFLRGLTGGTNAGALRSMFKGNVTILNRNRVAVPDNGLIGTGFIITDGIQEIIVVILGDANGDGVVDTKDYLLAKRVFLGTYSLDGAMLAALCLDGGSSPTTKDYLKIKRHFLGTYNIYS
ncbi:MAG: hypothetical protein CVU97_01060 [Firmicutes bacterium HGW-Firmicutes-21]|nr:MAG: hypothetical protein CVU97_01060 [Firmicutes bacterium HGW-Firmicutes-21]